MMYLKVGDIVRNRIFGTTYVVSAIIEYTKGKLTAKLKYLDRGYTGSGAGYNEHYWFTDEIFESESWYLVEI